MFKMKVNKTLVNEAYQDFKRRLLWQYHFRREETQAERESRIAGEKPDFDPDYKVESSTSWPNTSNFPGNVLKGFEAGKLELDRQLSSIPAEITKQRSDVVNLSLVRNYLETNNYLLKATDKNLGSAVITREWYMSEVEKFLRDTPGFDHIGLISEWPEYELRFNETHPLTKLSFDLLDKLDQWDGLLTELSPQLPKFLRKQVLKHEIAPKMWAGKPRDPNHPGLGWWIPTFSGLPKIHKNPWKLRPVIPCHSTIQAPVGVMISKLLRPLVDACPYVARGTKDFVLSLKDVTLNAAPLPGMRPFLCTGDITSFYTNIPLQECYRRAEVAFASYHTGARFGSPLRPRGKTNINWEYYEKFRGLFKAFLKVSCDNLVFRFGDKIFIQREGIAMGVSPAPHLANLYGDHEEWQFVKLLGTEHGRLQFYRRYIDDLFGIVWAFNLEEAKRTAINGMTFEGLEINWEVSEYNCVFLDLFIWIRPGKGSSAPTLHWKPYRKPLNHLERIPWGSFHPLDVKRGTFLGEMSRLAVLCSDENLFTEAIHDLIEVYLGRGYPKEILLKWRSMRYRKAWENRHVPKVEKITVDGEDEPNALVLKTHFNEIWNHVDITRVIDAARVEWNRPYTLREETFPSGVVLTTQIPFPMPHRDLFAGRVLVSRKKTHQLVDFANAINKKIINNGPQEDVESDHVLDS
jgi:hypothetical protein